MLTNWYCVIKPDCDKISFTETFMSCSTMFPTRVQEPVASSCGLNEYWVSSNDANRFSFMAQATHYAANTARPNGSATTLLYEQKSLPLLWKGFKCEWSLHFAAETISQAKQLIHFEGLTIIFWNHCSCTVITLKTFFSLSKVEMTCALTQPNVPSTTEVLWCDITTIYKFSFWCFSNG